MVHRKRFVIKINIVNSLIMELHNFRCCDPTFESKTRFNDDKNPTFSSEEQVFTDKFKW